MDIKITIRRCLTATAAILFSQVVTASDAVENTKPEFYGMLYVSMNYKDLDSSTDKANWQIDSNSSRLGLRQTLPLDNGLTAIWKLEVAVKLDDGEFKEDKHFTQRDIYLGLKGDYGQVIAGRFSSTFKKTEGSIDAFNRLHGDIAGVLGGQARVNNIVEYSSPTIANTVFSASFIPGENKDLDDDGIADRDIANAYGFSAVYKKDGVYAALAGDINGEAKTTTEINDRSHRVQLAGKYEINQWSFGGVVQHAQDANDSQLEENAFVINTTYLLDKYLLKAQYGLNKGKSTKHERELAAIGVDYLIQKGSYFTLDYAILADQAKGAAKQKDKVFTLGYSQRF